jgi:3-oxoacyl-[acyl-carrier protein] reductase
MAGIESRVAIITGGATGVGAATALMLAARGWRCVINYSRSASEAESTVQQCVALGTKAFAVCGDVARDEACRATADATVKAFGRIDALINSAGTTKFASMDDLDGQNAVDFQEVYAVNVIGAYQMTRAAAPAMKATGAGSVVNVSSISALTGNGSSFSYVASKAALNTLTLSLARALAPAVRVNCVLPGLIETRWLKSGLGQQVYDTVRQNFANSSALEKTCKPEDVADAILWLVEGAGLVTGQLITVDGGFLLGRPVRVSR